ncbi:helix-turn-helix domain-containing protein [Paenibacillus sp. ACRRX]|nr:helix-turn-helix domain-containing protein [Paenibacillus sp. ACRRX]
MNKQVIRMLYDNNVRVKTIAQTYNITSELVSYHALKGTLERNYRNDGKLDAFTASEIRRRREQDNLTYKQLADIYGIGKTTVYYICTGDQWSRKCHREECQKRIVVSNSGRKLFCGAKCEEIFTEACLTEFNVMLKLIEESSVKYETIGFLWGSARFSGDYFIAQTVRKDLLQGVKQTLAVSNKIFSTPLENDKLSWRLKIPPTHPYVVRMLEMGYSGRNDEDRTHPNLPHAKAADFYRGYFSVHHAIDCPKGKYRLRFYAAAPLLEGLNTHLSTELGVGIKKVQSVGNSEICKVLYYQSPTDVKMIADHLNLWK